MSSDRRSKRLGELLVEQKLLTLHQLDQALREQHRTREFLGAILIRLKIIQPEALMMVLSRQFGIPYEPLTPERVDWTLVKQFPASVLSVGGCFPIRGDAESVTVAIVNPLDVERLSMIERVVGFRRVIPVLVLERELQLVFHVYQQQALRAILEGRFENDGHHKDQSAG